jgi:NTP pyrophosphatase (non-canonical NTP hydrolase)
MADELKTLEDMQAEVAEVNAANGWLDLAVSFPELIALLHSEVSEALEAWRRWGLDDHTEPPWSLRLRLAQKEDPAVLPKPEGVGSEFADVFIRLLDFCGRFGIDLRAEYERKITHNRTRGYRHGGKRI